jgi:hypothetical protein
MTDPDVVAAWDGVHDALAALPGWEAARPSYHGEERLWVAYAHDARHTHGRQPHTFVEFAGDDRGGGPARASGGAAEPH